MTPGISVIVPVLNGEEVIGNCLEACLSQDLDRERYEVIVVDNGSTDKTRDIVGSFSGRGVVLTEEKKPSSYAARNKGIEKASGELLAFTDADCVPSKQWLSSHLDCINNGSKLSGGAVNVVQADPKSATETYDRISHLNQRIYVERQNFAATANLVVNREVFDEVGTFDEDLVSSGDMEFGQRASKSFDITYCEDAVVDHPARKGLRNLWRKNYRLGQGAAQLYRKREGKRLPTSDALRCLVPRFGYVSPEGFPRMTVESDDELPKAGSMRFRLFIIEGITGTAQFLGRLKGRRSS